MMSTILLLALLASGGVEISLAPDQPVPHVYIDDPLIVEFRSDQDVVAKIDLEIKPDFASSSDKVDLEPIEVSLRAQGTYWRAISSAPVNRGRYWVVARIDIGGQITERTVAFCRFDRPGNGKLLPVSAVLQPCSLPSLHASRDASLQGVCLDASDTDLAAQLTSAGTLGLQTTLMLDARHADICENLAKTQGERIVRWNLASGNEPANVATMAKALHRGGVKAPVFAVVPDAAALSALLTAGMGQYIGGVVVSGGDTSVNAVETLRAAAERAGYEGLSICASIRSEKSEDPTSGSRFCRQYLDYLSAGTAEVQVDGAFVYAGGIGAGYPYLNALARRLSEADYVGQLPLPAPAHNVIFRVGQGWVMALWSVQDAASSASQEVAIKLDSVSGLTLFDARNNPLPAPPIKDGQIVVNVAQEPVWISGVGGTVVSDAARNVARQAASVFVATEEFKARLSPDAIELVKKFASTEASGYSRLDFLNLLKMFPKFEELWHAGTLPRSMAVPAQAQLARLALKLCVVEQERGEAFVEPLQSTLGNCGQFQSLYLTSSSGASEGRERADWIYNEVARLMAEAEKLSAEGRTIEACGVAALAEWRARALEFAKKAQPLSAPEKEVALPPPAITPKATAADKAAAADKTATAEKDKTDQSTEKKPTRKRRKQ